MGRSSRVQAEANRQNIVLAAGALFRAHGVEPIGIADVMKAAGMTQGGFYRHFATKDALVAEACRTSFEQAAAKWREVATLAEKAGRKPREAITDYYGTSKPPELTCPMIAFAAYASRRAAGDPLRMEYEAGVTKLLEVYTGPASKGATTGAMAARQAFNAMVGARLIGLAG